MIAGVADTHTALWHLFGDEKISRAAEQFIQAAERRRDQIAVSTISIAELIYLTEKKRLPLSVYDDLLTALKNPAHVFTEAAVTLEVVRSMRQVSRAEVPDMPDRIIAATAIHFNVPVISRDRRIRSADVQTVW